MKERPHRVAGHVERRRTRHLRFQSRTLSRHRLSAPCHENNHLCIGAQLGFFLSMTPRARTSTVPGTGKKTPGGAGTHTRQTQEPHKPTSKPTPFTVHRLKRQTTPEPLDARVATHHTTRTRSSAVVVTVMATAPGRGSSEGASPTASVTAILRVPVKRHRGEPGHTRDTRDTRAHARAHGSHGRTSQPSTQIQRHTRTATDSTAARTAAGPESTAPRGRLRRGRPRRTRPCLHPLPERLPAPAQSLEGGRRNEGARGRCVTAGGAARALSSVVCVNVYCVR